MNGMGCSIVMDSQNYVWKQACAKKILLWISIDQHLIVHQVL